MHFTPGRKVTSISRASLPGTVALDLRNMDIDRPGEVSRRAGYQRGLTVAYGGQVSFLAKYEDYDGTQVYIVVSPDGVERET